MPKNKNKVCGRCGSFNLISDRSLGGKIICVNCGSSMITSKRIISFKKNNIYFLLLILFVFFIVIIL